MKAQSEQSQHEQSQEEMVYIPRHTIDELTKENQSLKEQLIRQERFTAIIAHELRNPLSPIINYTKMIARQFSPSSQKGKAETTPKDVVLRQTAIIVSQTQRLNRLIDNLLDASRLSSDHFTVKQEVSDITDIIQTVVGQIRPIAPYHTLIVQASEQAITCMCDRNHMQLVMGNLLDHAVKYADEGTTITIRIWTTPNAVHISIHHYGVALPSTDRDQVFHPDSRSGFGLGLYIAKQIIEAHHGTLQFETTEEATSHKSSETTITITLPL